MSAAPSLSPVPSLLLGQLNCDKVASYSERCGAQQTAVAAPWPEQRAGLTCATAAAARPFCSSSSSQELMAVLDAEVEAAARDTLLAQCQALLSLDDPESLPHDPLFDMLPPAGTAPAAVRRRRNILDPSALAAALAGAAAEAASLKCCPRGAGIVADSSQLAASTHFQLATSAQLLAPATCCRKRTADAAAPATHPCAPLQRRLQQQQLMCLTGDGGGSPLCPGELRGTSAGAAAAAATPCPVLGRSGGGGVSSLAAAKRQRTLLLTTADPPLISSGGACAAAAGAFPAATPGSGAGSNSKVVPAARQKAVRRVARDLSFTPAPAAAPREQRPLAGTPSTAGSVSQCSASKPLLPSRLSGGGAGCVLQAFSLTRSPNTRAGIDCLNSRFKTTPAAAAATAGDCTERTAPSPRLPRAFRSIRLC